VTNAIDRYLAPATADAPRVRRTALVEVREFPHVRTGHSLTLVPRPSRLRRLSQSAILISRGETALSREPAMLSSTSDHALRARVIDCFEEAADLIAG